MTEAEFVAGIAVLRTYLLKVAHRYHYSAAQDLVQDAYLQAWKNRDKFLSDPRCSKPALKAWLVTIVRNRALSLLRHEHCTHIGALLNWDESFENKPSPDNTEIGSILKDTFKHMAGLTIGQQQCLSAVVFDDQKYEEAADSLGIPVGTVKSRVMRARTRLLELA